MKPIAGLVIGLGFCISTFASVAPDSLTGKAYHEIYGFTGLRLQAEIIVLLGSDGKYTFLKDASDSVLRGPLTTLVALPRDGTYTYTRTGDATATLTLREPGGTLDGRNLQNPAEKTTSLTIPLTFSDTVSGQTAASPLVTGNFYLNDLSAANRVVSVANISMRGSVAPGRPLIAGFVVPGAAGAPTTQSRDVLVRVVGPGLTQFGVVGAWPDPDFSVQGLGIANTFSTDAHAGDWSANSDATATLEKISAYVGAFPLNRGSKDAVSVIRVIPGAYTIVASAAPGDPGGEALIEVYVLP